jgi:hypothetical protein
MPVASVLDFLSSRIMEHLITETAIMELSSMTPRLSRERDLISDFECRAMKKQGGRWTDRVAYVTHTDFTTILETESAHVVGVLLPYLFFDSSLGYKRITRVVHSSVFQGGGGTGIFHMPSDFLFQQLVEPPPPLPS